MKAEICLIEFTITLLSFSFKMLRNPHKESQIRR